MPCWAYSYFLFSCFLFSCIFWIFESFIVSAQDLVWHRHTSGMFSFWNYVHVLQRSFCRCLLPREDTCAWYMIQNSFDQHCLYWMFRLVRSCVHTVAWGHVRCQESDCTIRMWQHMAVNPLLDPPFGFWVVSISQRKLVTRLDWSTNWTSLPLLFLASSRPRLLDAVWSQLRFVPQSWK